MGLLRRRHFSVQGRRLLDIEDELFGEGVEVGRGFGGEKDSGSEGPMAEGVLGGLGFSFFGDGPAGFGSVGTRGVDLGLGGHGLAP